jgi:hypothetical protein
MMDILKQLETRIRAALTDWTMQQRDSDYDGNMIYSSGAVVGLEWVQEQIRQLCAEQSAVMDDYTLEQLQAGRLRIIALLATLPSRQTPAIPDALRIALALFDAEIARRAQAALLDELAEVVR